MKTIGIIGASRIARLAVARGYDVVVSKSRGPQTLSGLVRELGPHASAGTVEGAARSGDFVVVAIPLKEHGTVPVEALKGKIVIDTGNYYPARDGHIAELDDERDSTGRKLSAWPPAVQIRRATGRRTRVRIARSVSSARGR